MPAATLGIDGSNLRAGGGITHLVQLLTHAEPAAFGFGAVKIWGPELLLERLPERRWLQRLHSPALEGSLAVRTAWQLSSLGRWCGSACDLLFVPGGQYPGDYRPYVAMCRNMLPFEPVAARPYGWSPVGVRLRILRQLQARTFRHAAGVAFLTEAARQRITSTIGPLTARQAIIPHGVSDMFRLAPRQQRPITAYDRQRPFRWLYVSIIDLYKHQPEVLQAVKFLRDEGYPVAVDFVGSAYPPAWRRLERTRALLDPGHDFTSWTDSVPHDLLPGLYHAADGFVFASSCENLPNILLEAMSAGLPVACSDRSAMTEVVNGAAELFEPTDPQSIAAALRTLLLDTERRIRVAAAAYERAHAYDWSRCATETFRFLADVGAEARSA